VRNATGTRGNPSEVVAVTQARLAAIESGARAAAAPAHPGRRRATDPVAAAFADPWHRAVLAGWSVFEPLGKLATAAMTGPTSRAWFDELRLAPVVGTALRASRFDESPAAAAASRIRKLLALPRPSNVGGRTGPERARRLVEAWLAHPDVRASLRLNAWEGVEWFGREEWRELLDWALLLDRVDGASDGLAVVKRLLEAGDAAGYRVDKLRELLGPPRRAAKPATKPAAKTVTKTVTKRPSKPAAGARR
jgi:hypothetical protein